MQRIQAPESANARARRLVNEVQKNQDNATTLPALRVEVAKLSEAIELLLNKHIE